MPNTLSGKTNYSYCSSISLSGKQNGEKKRNHSIVIPNKIKELKVKILNDYLIPLYSKQWTILKENMFFISEIQKKIIEFNELYELDEARLYIDLLKVLTMFMDNYKLMKFQEEKAHGSKDPNEVMSMIFQTAMIKLLPEYEIYNSILGKPNRESKQVYDQCIIEDIKDMLVQENITFYKIKECILHEVNRFSAE